MDFKKFQYIKEYIECNFMDYLLDNNVTMVHFTQNSTTTFLLYKDELFIFDNHRSLNRAYVFYNVEQTLCQEGLEYYKITRNYEKYIREGNNDVQNGCILSHNKINYLVNYFSRGYKNKNTLSLKQVDNRMFYLIEFCHAVMANDLLQSAEVERTAVVTIKNKINYIVDMYPLEEFYPIELTKKFKANTLLKDLLKNKEYSRLNAKMGIFFLDGHRDCSASDRSRNGGFLYYALEGYNIILYPFQTISLNEIYSVVTSLLDEVELPISITTDNDFIYDIFYKTFDNKIDFILDKSDLHNKFIRSLGVFLIESNYDAYGLQGFSLIIENNYNEISSSLETLTPTEFDLVLQECIDSYRIENLTSEMFDYEEDFLEEDDEDKIDILEVDSKLLS